MKHRPSEATMTYVETWQPTPLLRWLRVVPDSHGSPVLEQEWRSLLGQRAWRVVEQVDAIDFGAKP